MILPFTLQYKFKQGFRIWVTFILFQICSWSAGRRAKKTWAWNAEEEGKDRKMESWAEEKRIGTSKERCKKFIGYGPFHNIVIRFY